MYNLTLHRLKEVLFYDPNSGNFTWINRPSRVGRIRIGQIAGAKHSHGYIQIQIDGKRYFSHRLAWFYMTAEWPIDQVDHINTIKNDNRWENLRQASPTFNMQNRRVAQKNSSTGLLGVLKSSTGRFCARITVNGKHIHLGSFGTPQEAHFTYLEAKRCLHEGNTL